jgi:hypothetical protein
VNSLAKPYSQCDEDLSGLDPSVYKAFNGTGKKYRRKDCLDIVIQRFAAKNCGCIFIESITKDDGEKYCKSKNDSCFSKIENLTNNSEFFKNCPLECNQTDYDISISTSSPSSIDYLKSFTKHNFEDQFPEDYGLVKSAFRVNIYFSELTYTQIVEVPNYTPISLISSIGGTLGLFLGMSLLSIIEIVDLLIQMILTTTQPLSNSNQVQDY